MSKLGIDWASEAKAYKSSLGIDWAKESGKKSIQEDNNAPLIGKFPEQVISGGKMSDTVSKDRPLSKEQINYALGLPQTSVKDERPNLGGNYEAPSEEARKTLLDTVTLKDGIEKLTTGMEQFGTQGALNQISGAVNMVTAVGEIMASPFTVADKTLRTVGLNKIADIASYPFEQVAYGVEHLTNSINEGFDLSLQKVGFDDKETRDSILNLGLSDKDAKPLIDAFKGANQLGAQLLLGKIAHSVSNIYKSYGTEKANKILKMAKNNDKSIIEVEQKLLEAPKRTFNVQPSGATRMDLTESAKEIAGLEIKKSEANKKLATATELLKSLPKRDARKKGLIIEIADAQKEFNRLDKEIIEKTAILEKQRKTTPYEDVSKQLPQFAQRTPVEGTGENIPSNINFSKAVQSEVGERLSGTGRYTEGIPPENAAPVFRSPQDYIENRKLDLWSVEPKSPLNVDALSDIINVAKQNNIEKEVYSILRTESMKRNRLQDFEQAWQDVQNNVGKREVVPTDYTEVQDLLTFNNNDVNKSQETTQNSPISSTEAQGKENAIKSIESINSETQGSLNASKEVDFANKQVEIDNIKSANDAIKFAEQNKGNEDVLNQLKTNLAETQTKATEALKNDSPDAELLQGKASILNDAVNELTKQNEVLNGKEQTSEKANQEVLNNQQNLEASNESTFGASIIPLSSDFTLKGMKENFIDNTESIKNVLAQGAKLIYEGTTDFKKWSAEMSKLYGDNIAPHLQRIWLQTQNVAKDDSKKFNKDVLAYAEEKGILPQKFTRAGRELAIENATLKIRDMINSNASEEDFTQMLKNTMFDSPQQQLRYETLHAKVGEEIKTDKQILSTDEKIEYDNLRKNVKGGLDSKIINNVRMPHQVVENVPTVKAIYQTEFEAARKAEIEKIGLMNNFTTLVEESRKSTGNRYDDNVIKALSGVKVNLTNAEQKLVNSLKEFITQASVFKEKLMENYDLPHKPRGFVEAFRKSGLYDALKEKMGKVSPDEVNLALNNFGSNKMFDPYSLTRFGRTKNPTMDILERLDRYVDIFTLQKNLEPVVPTIRRLEKAMTNAGLINNTTWSENYLKELFGEEFNTGMQGKQEFKTAMNFFNNVASVRHLAYNPNGGLGNLIGGIIQNITSKDISLKELAIGAKRLGSEQGFDILTERGIVDAPLLDKTIDVRDIKRSGKDLVKAVASPYQFYSAGEQIIQGMFYLGKLTPEEFRTKIIEASRDRQILEGKSEAQGGYHRGMRPSIVRTTLGKSAMKFRLWIPAVMETKVQKVISAGRLAESIWKGKDNITMKDKANLKASLKEIATLGSAVILLNELPDKTKKNLQDALSDAYGYLRGEYWWRQTQNVLPAAQTVSEIAYAVGEAFSGEVYQQDSKYGKEGSYKALGTLKRLTPTFAKGYFEEDYSEQIKEIMELNVEVNNAKEEALKYKTSSYVQKYKNLQQKLERLRDRSVEYQRKINQRERSNLQNERILNQ